MFHIYAKPLHEIWIYMVIGLSVWVMISVSVWHRFRQYYRIWQRINRVLLIGAAAIILYMTVYGRAGTERIVILQPFYSFIEARTIPEYYRTLLMNVFLFFPLGLVLPFALPQKIKHKILVTIGIAFLFSSAVEVSQFIFGLGRTEVDDVIMNTAGAGIGAIAYCVQNILLYVLHGCNI